MKPGGCFPGPLVLQLDSQGCIQVSSERKTRLARPDFIGITCLTRLISVALQFIMNMANSGILARKSKPIVLWPTGICQWKYTGVIFGFSCLTLPASRVLTSPSYLTLLTSPPYPLSDLIHREDGTVSWSERGKLERGVVTPLRRPEMIWLERGEKKEGFHPS
jgi:hypothetical protein